MAEHVSFAAGPRSEPRIVRFAEAPTAVVRGEGIPADQLPAFFDSAFQAIANVMEDLGLSPVGPAFAMYPRMPEDTIDVEVGFAVDHRIAQDHTAANGRVVSPSKIPEGSAATVSHMGSYEGLSEAWRGLVDWAAREGHATRMPFWEVYVTEPRPDSDPATLRTDLFLPVAG
jgi:effector-binding domain-containing protein